jgi:hypothetical protein
MGLRLALCLAAVYINPKQNLSSESSEIAFPEAYSLTDTENTILSAPLQIEVPICRCIRRSQKRIPRTTCEGVKYKIVAKQK